MSHSVRVLIILFSFTFSITSWAGPRPKAPAGALVYSSLNKEGLIGTTEESPADNPADNIFHVSIDKPLCDGETVWLVYDLDGVEDHTQVSRGINDQISVGGYLVKKRRGWATQYERIDASWLKTGDNIIRFTLPD